MYKISRISTADEPLYTVESLLDRTEDILSESQLKSFLLGQGVSDVGRLGVVAIELNQFYPVFVEDGNVYRKKEQVAVFSPVATLDSIEEKEGGDSIGSFDYLEGRLTALFNETVSETSGQVPMRIKYKEKK